MIKDEKEKKGLFAKLIDLSKPKQNPCCCGFEIEEITEEEASHKETKESSQKG